MVDKSTLTNETKAVLTENYHLIRKYADAIRALAETAESVLPGYSAGLHAGCNEIDRALETLAEYIPRSSQNTE